MRKISFCIALTSALAGCAGGAFQPNTTSATPTGVYEGTSQGERASTAIMGVLLALGAAAYYATYNK